MKNKPLQSLKYFLSRYVLRKKFLIGQDDKFGSLFKFKIEDDVGRGIYKRGKYEEELSDYIEHFVGFEDGDIALDIGANIGWYSVLLHKVMPESAKIYAFEPDPLNFSLLSENLKLNGADNVIPVNYALSDKHEIKKLYQYTNKNLGRHSLLDINGADYVEVETLVLDQFLNENDVDFKKIKFAKIDIEGYEYFALLGALELLNYVTCIISEFIPAHMTKGGVESSLLLDLLKNKQYIPHVIEDGKLRVVSSRELSMTNGCDLVWLKN